MLVVTGEARPVRASWATCSHSRAATSRPASSSQAQAIRQGSRIAASPPGIRTGHRWPMRSKPVQVAAQELAAPDRAVGAVAGAVVDRARRALGSPCSARHGGEVRVVVLDADRRAGRGRARTWSRGTPGAGRGRRARASTANSRSKCAIAVGEGAQRLVVAQVADVVRDPRAAVAGERERVLQLGADGQQRRRGARRGSVAGTYPRERRTSRPPRSTQSSVRVWIGRSCSRKRSAMPASRSSASSSVERDRLVGHVAAGHHERHADVGEQQVVQRRVGEHHAELARARRDRRRDARAGRRGAMHDRALARERARCRARSARARDVAHHQRERPVLAVLAGAQPRRRRPRRRRGTRGGSRRCP